MADVYQKSEISAANVKMSSIKLKGFRVFVSSRSPAIHTRKVLAETPTEPNRIPRHTRVLVASNSRFLIRTRTLLVLLSVLFFMLLRRNIKTFHIRICFWCLLLCWWYRVGPCVLLLRAVSYVLFVT